METIWRVYRQRDPRIGWEEIFCSGHLEFAVEFYNGVFSQMTDGGGLRLVECSAKGTKVVFYVWMLPIAGSKSNRWLH